MPVSTGKTTGTSASSGGGGARNPGGASHSQASFAPRDPSGAGVDALSLAGGKSGGGGAGQPMSNNNPNAPGLGLTTGKTIPGNTAFGPAGGRATRYGMARPGDRLPAAPPARGGTSLADAVSPPWAGAPAPAPGVPGNIVPVAGPPPGLSFNYNNRLPPGAYPGNYWGNPTSKRADQPGGRFTMPRYGDGTWTASGGWPGQDASNRMRGTMVKSQGPLGSGWQDRVPEGRW
jgi:hypothetical protein